MMLGLEPFVYDFGILFEGYKHYTPSVALAVHTTSAASTTTTIPPYTTYFFSNNEPPISLISKTFLQPCQVFVLDCHVLVK